MLISVDATAEVTLQSAVTRVPPIFVRYVANLNEELTSSLNRFQDYIRINNFLVSFTSEFWSILDIHDDKLRMLL